MIALVLKGTSEVRRRPETELTSLEATRVTVVVPTRDRPAYLPACLESILRQTAGGIDVVVIDNGSAVPAAASIGHLLHRVRLVRREQTGGSVANIDMALHLPSTAFVMVFHDDDTMHPRLIETQLQLLDTDPALRFVGAGYRQVTHQAMESFADVPEIDVERYPDDCGLVRGFVEHGQMAFSSVLYRRAAVEAHHLDGGRYGGHCDRPFLIRVSAGGPTALLKGPWMNYRIHQSQDSYAWSDPEENLVGLLETYREVLENCEDRAAIRSWQRYATNGLLDSYYATPRSARRAYADFLMDHLRAGRLVPTALRRRGLAAMISALIGRSHDPWRTSHRSRS